MAQAELSTLSTGRSAWDQQAGIEPQARIEDHALIGDTQTAALVTTDGAIDWLCLPHFDSDACFVSLLGNQDNGRWRIAPVGELKGVRRQYRPETLILETEFVTREGGRVTLIDFMPPRQRSPHLIRRVACTAGEVRLRSDCRPRFGFGRDVPRVATVGGATSAFAGPDALYLRGGPSRQKPPPLEEEFTLRSGDQVVYDLTWTDAFEPRPDPIDTWGAELDTEAFWTEWCGKLQVPEDFRESVVRSLITLKACTFAPTGGIVAAPTSSLPETLGGSRNWDYRFTWIRDASLTLNAFVNAGMLDEGKSFITWLMRAVAGDPSQLQIMYGIRAERRLTEIELPWLSGYGNSSPVRVGNGAYDQFQLDIFGEFAATAYNAIDKVGTVPERAFNSLINAARFVETKWMEKDHGIWEMRGPLQNFVASQVSAWVALDRASRVLSRLGREPQLAAQFARTARTIKDSVLREGFNTRLNTFTQYPGSSEVDASLLGIPIMGFLSPTDPRVLGTIAAIERDLVQDGLVLRYRTEANTDGLQGREGTFLACSFWLVQAYHLAGRHEQARELFDRLLGLRNDLGLLAEEYDPIDKRQLGNFPQAFSHLALVNTAYILQPNLRSSEGEAAPTVH